MKTMNQAFLFSSILFSMIALNANAALYDRGNGMIYDSTLNITWLQDFNYANTSNYQNSTTAFDVCGHTCNTGGQFWQQGGDASNWAASLTVGGVSGWQLPSANLMGNTTPSTDGSTDIGTNNIRSELGYLFYVELGNTADSGSGVLNTTFINAATGKTDSFFNVQPYDYWEYESGTTGQGWYFDMNYGYQSNNSPLDNTTFFATAVHVGDIGVPIPATVWLFGSGLLGLAATTRRKFN